LISTLHQDRRKEEMKKFFALALALVMALSLVACGSGGSTSAGGAASGKTLKIGVFEPASGDNGAGGKQEVLGIQYANSVTPTVDINGETYNIELKIVDNQSSTDKAVSAAQELVSAGVSVVLGTYGSGCAIAAAPVFGQAQIPAIGCSCTNPAVTAANPYYFRVCFLDPFQGPVMANYAKDQFSAKKAYILTMLGEDYGSNLGTYFSQEFEKLGGEVKSESFPEGTSDFSAYIQNAVSWGADVIFAPSATTYASLIIGQASSAGLSIPILAGDTWESSVILDAQKGTGLQVYCSTFFDENDESGEAASFVKGFKEWLNADNQRLTNNGGNDIVAAVSALGYDAYMTAIQAITLAQSDKGSDIQAAMFNVDFDAVTGHITIDAATGDANKTMAYIKQATDGTFTFIKTQSVSE
jgi:branched-chain amino acid transport system substrate-binding protein